jgi:hypothetical protein
MARWIVGIAALLTLHMFAAPRARAQAADNWPSAGTQLIRVREASVPPTSDMATGACAMRLRDPGTGREYMVRHSTAQTAVAQHAAGATTSTSTTLLHAAGEYARVEPKGDTLSTRIITVDCLSSRVIVARRAGT